MLAVGSQYVLLDHVRHKLDLLCLFIPQVQSSPLIPQPVIFAGFFLQVVEALLAGALERVDVEQVSPHHLAQRLLDTALIDAQTELLRPNHVTD